MATPDRASAKAFYAGLLGWQAQDVPMGPAETYTLFQIAGKSAAGAFDLSHVKQPGVPPHWMIYVAVASADGAAARAAELGATVVVPPLDVPGQGRMTVLRDPTGAHFSLWQANPNPGLEVSGPNTLCWADCMTPDPARAAEFYRALFGWKLAAAPKDPSGYLHIQIGETYIGGVPPVESHGRGIPPH
ncbi:MAG: VOC family protein, partial [Terriglobales bacterium]